MDEEQVLADAEAEAGQVAAVGEVDVVEVKAVEAAAVESDLFKDFPVSGDEDAVEGFDGNVARSSCTRW